MRIQNDPIRLVVRIVKKRYPAARALIFFVAQQEVASGAYGHTLFPDDGSIPHVLISVELPVIRAVEILAHELAHVVVGPKGGHGKEWNRVFRWIKKEYCASVLG